MGKKCCKYEPYEDGSSGKANHSEIFQDGSGRKASGKGASDTTWSREDGSGSSGEQHSPLSLRNHEKGK